jgi:hypothetical protein
MTESRFAEVDFVEAVKRRQRASLVATLVTTAVLVAAGGGFLIYSISEIADKQAQLSQLTAKLDDAQSQLTMMETVVAEKTKEADDAANLAKQIYPMNWADEKLLFSQFGNATRFLIAIADAQRQNAHWGVQGGETLERGFTSPGFANYILSKALPGTTFESLPLRQGAPHPGDIIRYDPPYTMFYFPDSGPSQKHEGFVVGMTPLGIASLTRSFTPKIVEIRRTPLSQ